MNKINTTSEQRNSVQPSEVQFLLYIRAGNLTFRTPGPRSLFPASGDRMCKLYNHRLTDILSNPPPPENTTVINVVELASAGTILPEYTWRPFRFAHLECTNANF